jgi:glycosyltransferase involved in cell wall biosynthesis
MAARPFFFMKTVCLLVQNRYDMDIRVRRKAEALVAAGFAVDVLALASSSSQPGDYTLNGVNVYTLSLGKRRGSLARYAFEYLAFFCWAFWKLSVLMEKRHYKAVDVNTLPDFLIFAAVYAKLRGAKLILDMHEITPEFYMSKYGLGENAWSIRLHKLLERLSFGFADHVLTINEPITKLLEGRGLRASKTTVIMNAVDDALFAAAVNEPPARPSDVQEAKFVMMYHGTLTRIYGLDIAIEAFGEAHREMPGAEFWILGNGPEKQALENLVQRLGLGERVKFIGNVLPQEVPRWLKRCEVGVLPTRRDVFLDFSFSNKLSEYIIMGKGIICSRLKAIRHYFSEEAFAFFEPNNSADLARQMVRMYNDPGLRLVLAERAKREYAPICWDVMKQRYLETVNELITDRCGSLEKQPTPAPAALSR